MPTSAYIKSKVTVIAKALPESLPKGMAAKIITTLPRGELRQRFVKKLTLKQLARRKIESYTD